MNCRDAERLIDTFFDGELDGRLMREAALHVTRCRRCESEVQDRERIHDVLRASVDEDLAGLDLAALWKGIEPALEAERPPRTIFSWRLAAASTSGTGMLRAGRDPREGWASVRSGGMPNRVALRSAGMVALAASVALAVSLGLQREGTDGAADGAARLADTAEPLSRVASRAPSPPETGPVLAAGLGGSGLVRPVASRSPRRGGQVQIESVDSRAGAMAMWSVPASDTAVIWVGTAEPRARQALTGR